MTGVSLRHSDYLALFNPVVARAESNVVSFQCCAGSSITQTIEHYHHNKLLVQP